MSQVSRIPAVSAPEAEAHFARRLAVETDCADVASSMRDGLMDFVLLHSVGSPAAFAHRHVPGAHHLPHGEITVERIAQWPVETLFVVYCAGPHCNGADQAALKLARLGRPVKIMIGGITGWEDEKFPFATGAEPGAMVQPA